MMRYFILLVGIAFIGPAWAAPIPKSLKKLKNSNYDGVWELVAYNYDSTDKSLSNGKYWEVKEGTLYFGMPSVDKHLMGLEGKLNIPDENRPQYKEYGGSTCLLDLDGDQLKWIFCQEKPDTLTSCEPGQGRHLYTFKRVK